MTITSGKYLIRHLVGYLVFIKPDPKNCKKKAKIGGKVGRRNGSDPLVDHNS